MKALALYGQQLEGISISLSYNISSCVSKTVFRCYMPSPLRPSQPLPILVPCHGSSRSAVWIDCTLRLLQKSPTGSPVESCRTLKKEAGGEQGPFCIILTSLRWIWNNCMAQIWVSRSKVQTQRVPATWSGSRNSRCQKPGIRLMKESPCTIKGIYWEAFLNIAPCLLAYSLHVWMSRSAQWGGRCCTPARAKALCALSNSFWNMHDCWIT